MKITTIISMLCFSVLVIGLSGCTSKQAYEDDERAAVDNAIQQLPREKAKDYAVYAMMSSNAYLNKEPYFELENLGWGKVDLKGKPVGKNENSYTPRLLGKLTSGLQFDIWENGNKTVFAYKGSDGVVDWIVANLWPFGPSVPYKSALKKVREYKLEKGNQGKIIIATGHSLGGAIAVSMSLWEKGVEAYSFNGSPRFYDGLGDNKEKNIREAIFQEKDTLFNISKKYPKFVEVMNSDDIYQTNFDFKEANNHRIDYLAEGLLRCSDNVQELRQLANNLVHKKLECSL